MKPLREEKATNKTRRHRGTRRKDEKIKFDEDVVNAAAEMASEREDRMWPVELERAQEGQAQAQRGLVRIHPCA